MFRGIRVIPRHHAQRQIHIVAVRVFGQQRKRPDQFVHVQIGNDAATGHPSHGPGRLTGGIFTRPGECKRGHCRNFEPGGHLHGGIQFLSGFPEFGMFGHIVQIQIAEMHGFKLTASAEQENIRLMLLRTRADAVHIRVGHGFERKVAPRRRVPEAIRANLFRLGKRPVIGQSQFSREHGEFKRVIGHEHNPVVGMKGDIKEMDSNPGCLIPAGRGGREPGGPQASRQENPEGNLGRQCAGFCRIRLSG